MESEYLPVIVCAFGRQNCRIQDLPRGHAFALPNSEQLCAYGVNQCAYWKANLEV